MIKEDSFCKVWCKHFNKNKTPYSFHFIDGISFVKSSFPFVYQNVGKNLTKGVSYILESSAAIGNFKNKVGLIYDVPQYFEINTKSLPENIKLLKVKQYLGLLTNLEKYKDFNEFLSSTFSKKSCYKFKSYQKKLESSFDIRYNHFYGDITKEAYDVVFKTFNILLEKRFDDKLESNNNLDPNEWNFYYESSFEMILEKKASLFVIYDKEMPIAISLNYFSKDILFFAMTVFDIDYFKFNLGKVHLMKLYEWCFSNNIKTFDLSKGYYDYKERWANVKYNFEYHIYYDSKSVNAIIMAKCLQLFFKLKQFLRDKKINILLHRIIYIFKFKKQISKTNYEIKIVNESVIIESSSIEEIDVYNKFYGFLKKILIDYVYNNSERLKNVKVYKFIKNKNKYLIINSTGSSVINILN